MSFICGGRDIPPGMPLAGDGDCCMGAIFDGPDGCTCWEPVYDPSGQEPVQEGPPVPRATMCGDCAYRPGSPERQGDDGYAGDQDELDSLVYSGRPFACHTGMRRRVAWRHPSGLMVPAQHDGDYAPPVRADRAWQADGRPAMLCGGWYARWAHFQRTGRIQ